MEEIQVETGPIAFTSAGIREPKAGVEGKFSLWFLAALALSEGSVTLNKFTDQKVNDPGLIRLRKKVNATMNRKLKLGAKVKVIMKDGTKYTGSMPIPKGHPANPLSFEDLERKFMSMAKPVISQEKIRRLTEGIRRTEELSDVSEIFSLIQ